MPLVLFAAKRARQINAYYSQLGEGLLENVGPLVETSVQEKPLTHRFARDRRAVHAMTPWPRRPRAEEPQDSGSTRSGRTFWPDPAPTS